MVLRPRHRPASTSRRARWPSCGQLCPLAFLWLFLAFHRSAHILFPPGLFPEHHVQTAFPSEVLPRCGLAHSQGVQMSMLVFTHWAPSPRGTALTPGLTCVSAWLRLSFVSRTHRIEVEGILDYTSPAQCYLPEEIGTGWPEDRFMQGHEAGWMAELEYQPLLLSGTLTFPPPPASHC